MDRCDRWMDDERIDDRWMDVIEEWMDGWMI